MNGQKQNFFRIFLAGVLILLSFAVYAQENTVTGKVYDVSGEPIIGASVVIQGTTQGTITDMDGAFQLKAQPSQTLVVSFLGYKDVILPIGNKNNFKVTLEEDSKKLDEVVVVGYATQKKVNLTGSVASVSSKDIQDIPVANTATLLQGRLPGLVLTQNGAQAGNDNPEIRIRGIGTFGNNNPMVLIDGVEGSLSQISEIPSADIDNISVLKDAASAAIYGVRAANGVVLVTTKKGGAGKTEFSYNGSYTFQQPSRMPELCDPYESMTLFNEMSMNNINGGSWIFSEESFEAFRNGTRRTTDWNDLIISNVAPQTQHDISISGGTEKTKFYISMGYFYQEGIFRSGDLNYNKFNLRSNISTEIAKGIKFELGVSGISDERNTPYTSSQDIIRNYWRQGVLYPAYADPEGTMLNYNGLDMEQNTVAMMTADVSGYKKYKQKYFQSSATLTADFGEYTPVLKGLTAKAMFSYDYRADNNEAFRKEYYQYAYDEQTGTYNQKVYNESSPSNMRREFYDKSQMLGQFTVNYDRTFNDVHHVGGVIGWEVQKRNGDNFYAVRDLAFSMPYLLAGVTEGQIGAMQTGNNDLYEQANEALIGRINYSFADRYLLEAQFRYDGSSKFAKGHQWGFFPSVSAGWRISEEPFFKSIDALKFVNQLKLRASYGILGDDGDLNYDWAMGYTYPSTSGNMANGDYNGYSPGYIFGGKFISAASPMALPNENITWFKSKTFDIGFDFEGWDGLLGVSFDYFNRLRTGRFARRTGALPTVVGATAPRENLDSDRQFGMELELTHRNKIGEVGYNLKGIATVTRQKYLTASEKGPWANSYDRWRNDNLTNRYQGVQFGYTSAGRYTSWNDIWNYYGFKERDVLPGDYKYEDWNGDGEINGQDEHPFAFDQTPWLQFSLNAGLQWKNFDFNMLLQGSALGSMEYKEPLHEIWGKNGGGALTQFLDRWHPVDPKADPYDPSTVWTSGHYAYTGRWAKNNSAFNRVSTAYLRLKSIELGYTFPKLKQIPNASLRVYANAYNLLTFTGVKFVDPEHPDDDLGRMYPLNKTYTLGVSLSF